MRQFFKLLLVFLLAFDFASAQKTVVNTGAASIVQREPNRQVTQILTIPVYSDTTSAIPSGYDSLGMLIFVKTSSKMYKRDTVLTGGHVWTEVGSSVLPFTTTTSGIVTPNGSHDPKKALGTDNVFIVIITPGDTVYLHGLAAGKRDVTDTAYNHYLMTRDWLYKFSDSAFAIINTKLSSASVTKSITGDGTSGNPLQLVNDAATPGANKVYGTDGSGTKGWQTSASGGTDTTHGAGYNLGISRTGNKVTYYSADTLEGRVGQIYRANSFASTTGFTNNGSATFTASGGVIAASGGAGLDDFTNSLDYNYITGADKWGFYVVLKTGTAAANVGMSIGIRSTNSFIPSSMAIQFDGSNSSHAGRVYLRALRSVNFVRVDSTPAISFTAGDKIDIRCIYNRYSVTIFARNQTTNSAFVPIVHNFGLLTTSDAPPNTGKFAIWQHGGSNEIDSLAISIYSFTNPALTVLGDSRLFGDYVGDAGQSFVQQLANSLGSVVNLAKPGDRTTDIYSRVTEAISTHAHQYLYMAGVNDIIQGRDTNLVKTDITNTYNALSSTGAKVWFLLPWYSSVQDQTWEVNFIKRTFPNWIDTWTPSVNCNGCRLADNIHYTIFGNGYLARKTLDTNVLVGYRTRLPDSTLVTSAGLWSGNDSLSTVPYTTVDNQIISDNSFVYDRKSRRMAIYPGVGPSSGLLEPTATIDVNTGNMNAATYLVNHSSGGAMSMGPISLFKSMNGLNFNSAWQMGLDNSNLSQFYLGSPNTGAFHLFDRGGNDFINANSQSLISNLTVNGGSVYAGSSNANGPVLQLNGGFGSGTGVPGDIVIGLTTPTGSGSTLQTITNQWWFKGSTGGFANKISPSASAILDLSGTTTKGVLFPILNTTQQSALSSPATSLHFVNSDSGRLGTWNGSKFVCYATTDMVPASAMLLDSGSYTPTVSSTTNITSTSTPYGHWRRQGNTVTVYFSIVVQETAATTGTSLNINLPVSSSLSANPAQYALMGSANTMHGDGTGVPVFVSYSGSSVTLTWNPASVTLAGRLQGSFQYVIN